jgi:hypothetical protein
MILYDDVTRMKLYSFVSKFSLSELVLITFFKTSKTEGLQTIRTKSCENQTHDQKGLFTSFPYCSQSTCFAACTLEHYGSGEDQGC